MDGTAGPGMLPEGLAGSAKLTVYLGRQERARRMPAFVAVCDLLHRREIAGATALAQPQALPGTDEHGMALRQKLMIYSSEAARHQGQPIHRAISRPLRAAGISGATTLRGVWGFHGDHRPHGDRVLSAARRVPAVTIVIDAPDRMAAAFAIVDELTAERGLVTAETIRALRAAAAGRDTGGLRLAAWRDW